MYIKHWSLRAIVTLAALVSTVLLVVLIVDPTSSSIDGLSGSTTLRATIFFVALISTVVAFEFYQEYCLVSQLNAHLATLFYAKDVNSIDLDVHRRVSATFNQGTYRVEITFVHSLRQVIYVVSDNSFVMYQNMAYEMPIVVGANGSWFSETDSKKLRLLPANYKKELRSIIRALNALNSS